MHKTAVRVTMSLRKLVSGEVPMHLSIYYLLSTTTIKEREEQIQTIRRVHRQDPMVCNHSVFNPTSHAIKPPVVHPSLKEIVRTTSRSPAQPHAPVCGSSRTTSRHRVVRPAAGSRSSSRRRSRPGRAPQVPQPPFATALRSPSRRPGAARAAPPRSSSRRPEPPFAAGRRRRNRPSPQVSSLLAAPCPPPLLPPV